MEKNLKTRDLKKLIAEMTLEEKASLCSGLDASNTKAIERLGIPTIAMTDGPSGLRKADGENPLWGGNSIPATVYPSGATLAASWDVDLMESIGAALGRESQAQGIGILLGPAINIKRSPLCGRNFEYYSEDPYLTGQMAAAYIKGVQREGVGTSVKHFALNNQETRRMSVNAVVDERTLREIYLAGFECAVKQSQPWTIMASYNRVNGTYVTQHPYLLNDVLRDEWGFEGFVMSDWGAVDERVPALAAGLDLEMPGNGSKGDRKIVEAVRNGTLSEDVLDRTVERMLAIIFQVADNRKAGASFEAAEHHKLARKAASECMVLLKNDDAILPLQKKGRIAVIGEFAKKLKIQGGSSKVNPTKIDDPWEELLKLSRGKGQWTYAQGYELANEEWNEALAHEAVSAAGEADVAIVFAGLPRRYESETYDRKHMCLPESHNRLIEAVAAVQPNVVVVLCNGSPVEMPWIGQVKAVLEAYLGGQAAGGAIADLLLGEANPSGKLAETFPLDVRHNPSHFNFPGEGDEVVYREGLMVGYRHYEARAIKPLFAFGHGLSYTTFAYTGISIDKREMSDDETVQVSVTIKNNGGRAGKEVVQLYIRDVESSVARPEKELKGFRKVHLEPGEEKTVTFTLDKRSFAYYNPSLKDWHVESGEFEVLVGGSSDRIMLSTALTINSTVSLKKTVSRNTTLSDLMAHPVGASFVQGIMNSYGALGTGEAVSDDDRLIIEAALMNMPLRNLISDDTRLEDILAQINA